MTNRGWLTLQAGGGCQVNSTGAIRSSMLARHTVSAWALAASAALLRLQQLGRALRGGKALLMSE